MSLRAIIWAAVSTTSQTEPEHFSLPAQERDGLALCEREGWQVIDILRVPGHSRAYKSLDKLASDAQASPLKIDAFYRLIAHLEKGDFDVIVCRDANRFARKASLLHFIVESVIEDCGGRIYSLTDGWIDEKNAGMWAAMKGYSSAQEVKFLKDAWQRGADLRIERGVPTGPWVPLSHKRIRDPLTGKDMRLELDESRRPLFDDLATLILEGVGWLRLPYELYTRFGHLDQKSGRQYSSSQLYYLVHNPALWGHMARNHTLDRAIGRWVYDDSVPLPDGVKVKYNVIPAVWTGELAERIKAELRRRTQMKGRAYPADTYRFSQLCVCGECGSSLSTLSRRGIRRGVRCHNTRTYLTRGMKKCTQQATYAEYLTAFFTTLLEQLLDGVPPSIFDAVPQVEDSGIRLTQTQDDITTLETQIGRLIMEQSNAPESVQAHYRTQIRSYAERLDILKVALRRLETQSKHEMKRTEQTMTALEELRALSIERFWQLPDREVNQYLHRIFGKYKIIILDRVVVGITIPQKVE